MARHAAAWSGGRGAVPHDADPDVDRARYLALVQHALADALAGLEAHGPAAAVALLRARHDAEGDRARARRIGSHGVPEARTDAADDSRGVERRLRDEQRLTDAEIALCFDYARTDPAFDLARTLPPPEREYVRLASVTIRPRGWGAAEGM